MKNDRINAACILQRNAWYTYTNIEKQDSSREQNVSMSNNNAIREVSTQSGAEYKVVMRSQIISVVTDDVENESRNVIIDSMMASIILASMATAAICMMPISI